MSECSQDFGTLPRSDIHQHKRFQVPPPTPARQCTSIRSGRRAKKGRETTARSSGCRMPSDRRNVSQDGTCVPTDRSDTRGCYLRSGKRYQGRMGPRLPCRPQTSLKVISWSEPARMLRRNFRSAYMQPMAGSSRRLKTRWHGYAWEHSEFAKPASGQSPRHVSKPCLGRISVQSVRSSTAFSSRNDEAPSEASRSQDCANARKCQRKKEGALPGRFSRRWLVNSDAKTTDLLLKSPPFLL